MHLSHFFIQLTNHHFFSLCASRGPKVKSRPPPNDPTSLPDVDLHPSDDSRSLHSLLSCQQSQQSHLFDAALDASSPHPSPIQPPGHSHLSSEVNKSDSGSLVTDRILQAEGPGINYYMSILPRDMAAMESSSLPVMVTQDRPNDTFNNWQTPTSDRGASDIVLSKLADHPDVIRGLYW